MSDPFDGVPAESDPAWRPKPRLPGPSDAPNVPGAPGTLGVAKPPVGGQWAPPTPPGGVAGPSGQPEWMVASSPVVVGGADAAPAAPPRRSRGKLVGALVGVAALLGAGAFAVVQVADGGGKGGASSPTEVGDDLIAALNNEDVLGVVDLLLPGEREAFRQPLIDLVDNLKRLDVLSDGASLDKIGGLDLQVTAKVREEPTNVADIANIFLTGSSSATVDGKQVPLGSLLIEEAFDGERPDLDAAEDTSHFKDQRLTVVERDGRWYLSAFYTLAEEARGDLDVPTTGVAAAGADTPEEAVGGLITSMADLDLKSVIAGLDPTEFEALQRYAPLFLSDAQSELRQSGVAILVHDASYSVTGSGDRQWVKIDSIALTVTAPDLDSPMDITVADGCVTVVVDGETVDSCDLASDDSIFGGLGDDSEAGKHLQDVLSSAFEDADVPGIAVHQVDGRWYLSPLRTYTATIDAVLTALDSGELHDIIKAYQDFIGSFDPFGSLGGLDDIDVPVGSTSAPRLPGVPTTTPDGQVVTQSPVFTLPSSAPGGYGPSATTADPDDEVSEDADYAAFGDCYARPVPADVVACLQAGIAAGTIDPLMVSAAVRYTQCGVAEQYVIDVYSLADSAFTSLVTAAAPCFQNLVQIGAVDSYEVPYELLAPQCIEGRNLYTAAEDDPGYITRITNCFAKAVDD